jgi:predicted GNAT superfamily acetyltransferase
VFDSYSMSTQAEFAQRFTKIYAARSEAAREWREPAPLAYDGRPKLMEKPGPTAQCTIRELEALSELELALQLEKEIWEFDDADVTPLALAAATRASGSIWLGAFQQQQLAGFAFAFPSLEQHKLGFHSHTVGVRASQQSAGVGFQLKLAQRKKVLALGLDKMTWTFDPLRARNAHFNFSKLGVLSNSYRIDFYGSHTSSPLFGHSTDRLWVSWHLDSPRVEERLKGKNVGAEVLDSLAHLNPLVRFNGDGQPVMGDFPSALGRQRAAIEVPGDFATMEVEDGDLAREWRFLTRHAFGEALKARFMVTEFCRSIRGQQGPGAYLLEKAE